MSPDTLKRHIKFDIYTYEILFTFSAKYRRLKIVEQAYLLRRALLEQCIRRGVNIYAVMEYHLTGDIHCHAFAWQRNTKDRDQIMLLVKYWKRNYGITFARTLSLEKYAWRYDYIHKQKQATGYPPITFLN